MNKPTPELVDAFLGWFKQDQHAKYEDYYAESITHERLSQLSREDFIEFFFEFARDGGKVQSGGYRTAPLFRSTIEAHYEAFRAFVLEPFEGAFDELKWLERTEEYKGFGQGLATIYLNRVDKRRFAIANNKGLESVKLLGVDVPVALAKRYEAIRNAHRQLMEWYPEFENYFRTDALAQFLIGEAAGRPWAARLSGQAGTSTRRYWVYAPGEEARLWDQYSREGVMGVGWDKIREDLSGMDEARFKAVHLAAYGEGKGRFQRLWSFVHEMREGDRIFAKRGLSEIVGYGEVTSAYFYDADRPEYRHLRRVRWLRQGAWDLPEGSKSLPQKALTEVTDPARIQELLAVVGVREELESERQGGQGAGERRLTERTFELLNGLHQNPTAAFYSENAADFKRYVEQPLQDLLNKVAGRLLPFVTERLETQEGLFSRIRKNDWGRGGAWDYYWGAFYPKGGRRIADPQLFSVVHPNVLTFGFYVGEYGSKASSLFVKNCQTHAEMLKRLLEPGLSDKRLVFGTYDRDDPGRLPTTDDRRTTWDEWLQDPEKYGIRVGVALESVEVVASSKEELVDSVQQVFHELFPLILLANQEDPLPDVQRYLEAEPPEERPSNPAYPLEQCASETHFALADLERWVRAIESKKQAIIYGPPGTGKTYLAERLARHLVGGGDGFAETVQFHPSYAYEDFVQGLRPTVASGGRLEYSMIPGRFKEFCRLARNRKARCVLIIDEINRANLSRVFGELMYLLEYRQRPIPLAGGETFQIPENIRIIGTMNTADRSIALVDHALRRRFAFLGLYPDYGILREYHANTGFDPSGLIAVLERLNSAISDKHYSVGITFFLDPGLGSRLQDVWQMEIEPYIEELFFDQPEKAAAFSWPKVKDEITRS